MNIDTLQQFDQWNEKKKGLHTKSFSDLTYFHEGDIWWCSVGLNVGKEIFGKGKAFRRPVLILKKLSNDLCIVLPLSSVRKEGSWFIEIDFFQEKRCVMLNQIRMYDKKRFQHKMEEVSVSDFIRVKEKLEDLLELSKHHHPASAGIEGISPQSPSSIACAEIVSTDCPFCSQFEPFIAEYFDMPENP